MDKKAAFQQVIAEFIEWDLRGVKPRQIAIPLDVSKIISVIGPRRAGKTYVLFDLIRQLRHQKIPANRLVYVNFEDDRLFPLGLGDMDSLLRGYYEMFPHNKDEKVFFFLDEVQEVENWEKFVRRLFDQENCRVYITGSSAKLLSRDLATTLRGRTLPYRVLPLSFGEFLQFNEIKANRYTTKGKAFLLNNLQRYLRQGGFPELIFLNPSLHNRLINEYIDLMLYRDLTERFSLRNPTLIKYLLKHLLANLGTLTSVTKVYNDLKSQGYKVGKNTIFDYISYLEEAFLIFRVDMWSRSVRKQAVNPSKVYGIDPAFKYAMNISEDRGRVFENSVFLELYRREKMPHYYVVNREVDFYLEEDQRLINACYEYTLPATRKREIEGLFEAMKALNLKTGELLTWDFREEIKQNDRTVLVRPLWEFLLEKDSLGGLVKFKI